MWETQHNTADWDCFKTLILQEILKTQNQHQEEFLCIFGSHTFVPISWMCKKQASVSHSFTGSEIISLDAGLRMAGLPPLDLWDVVTEVLRSSNSAKTPNHPAAGNCSRDHKSKPIMRETES